MPRKGITQDDVATAMSTLERNGKNPSVRLVRKQLGTGSTSTILRHMAAVRAGQKPSLESTSSIPHELQDQVNQLVESFWTSSLHTASKENLMLRQAVHQQAYAITEIHENMLGNLKQFVGQIDGLHKIGDGLIQKQGDIAKDKSEENH